MAFELTPTLSTFDVPTEENPFSDSGAWSAGYALRPPLMGGAPGGGSVHGSVEFVVNGMYYLREAFLGPVIEAFGCTPDPDLGAAVESQRVALWTDPQSLVGYSAGYGGGISQFHFLRRYDPDSFTTLGTGPNTTENYPEKIGLRITPERVEQWSYYTVGGWTLINYDDDLTYRDVPFYAALETEEQGGINEVGFTCFGASVPNRTQIYRVVKGLELEAV